ncbi:hypothetical protein IWW55_000677 [Coemansia sp. RSA 2706]|nr:hypothetical protein IWW55_000677 [Coemansia sp. RSA 2706]KAJ2314763.1 hypothetical protein IWW54_000722 [Coemansia sp. RSA 2705]KAJ2321633.1 hypothetical protein IWW52_000627 [Coemansia sp. RSA 2704]KAJ2329330.1 hypothetical protein IWW51_000667 [Coemansia sp. RSA 2702]KAJ2369496.1 hypothetical protein H4S01_000962 [Coemansia sp. RSA 2610]KAJ2392637.1 hypothetical protein H4S02_000678 [Coemansia sp. RSA 2611]KAJ2739283.1 hypothetical protein H4R23_000573 [Coemansia sp. Cherry 401B]
MDKQGEFIAGLQTILDSPNPPHDELVRVIASTQRDFLSSALALSTVSWPSRTFLELVKIVLNQPIADPAHSLVVGDPNSSHEQPPFFADDYFDKLRQQLLSMPVQQLADPNGSWVRNIGFSIEATVMQAIGRMNALEQLEEQAKAGRIADADRVRVYCAHVLGSGTLALPVWQAIARMMCAMFYVLPCSTRTLAGDDTLHPWMANLVAHYGSWLQIVQQLIENHSAALCRRMPTVIEDPATRQFRWGIPTLHAVAATEVLRNVAMRCTLLRRAPKLRGSPAAGVPAWAASASALAVEEQRLEQLEQAVLGAMISKDASAVYGMMSELHGLLQVAHTCTRGPLAASAVPGSAECLKLSMTRTCYGLAPILGFEEQALTQAMDMDKLLECLVDMKHTALTQYHAPLYGRYPHGAGAALAYVELLLLRSATTLFNIDWSWGAVAESLSPAKVPDLAQDAVTRLSKALRLSAMLFDVFALNTAQPVPDDSGMLWMSTATTQLAKQPFMTQPYSDDLSRILSGDTQTPGVALNFAESIALGVEWVCDFITSIRELVSPQLLHAQCAATLEGALSFYTAHNCVAGAVKMLELVPFAKWQAMGATRVASDSGSMASLVWASAQQLRDSSRYNGAVECSRALNAEHWQRTVSLCYPADAFVAYIAVVLCVDVARQLVRQRNGSLTAELSQQGVDVLRRLERALGTDGRGEWAADDLLFVPPIYTEADGKQAAQCAQTHVRGAVQLLATAAPETWAQQLGVSAAGLGVSEADMRQVATLISDYAHNTADMLALMPRLLLRADADADAVQNPFLTANILTKLPPIESQTHPNACNIEQAVRQWRRVVTQQAFAQSGKCVQELVARCYPSNVKHYLDAVLIRFMEAEPVVGVELVIGSIADFMWKSQIVYSRRAGPFYAVRNMFITASGSARADSLNSARADSTSSGRGGPRGGADDVEPDADETVRCPTACLRILLLLTALRYGNSMRDTPIHMWLTDCLDAAPVSLLRAYFDHAIGRPAPSFSPALPVEPDWPRKVKAAISLWMGDRRLRSRPLAATACVTVIRSVLQSDEWTSQWAEWAPVLREALVGTFTRPEPTATAGELAQLMLAVPVVDDNLAAHPISMLADAVTPADERERLAFADSRDWFLGHILVPALEADSKAARSVVAAVLASPESLGRVVPWLDVAASLVQNVPLGNGCPVAMTAELAKTHFVGYMSPLTRVLLAIAAYVEGDQPPADGTAEDDAATFESTFDWAWLGGVLQKYTTNSSDDARADTLDALLDVYTYCSIGGLRRAIEETLVVCGENDTTLPYAALERALAKRPLDVFTLHAVRPRAQSGLAPLTPVSASDDAPFRPGAELYPLARRLLEQSLQASGAVERVVKLVEAQLWSISEEPDVRRNLIALKPRLIPKDQRPAATSKSMTHEVVLQTTSGHLHIASEAAASAAAYALDRSVYLLGLVAEHADGAVHELAAKLAQSRVLLAVLMVAVGDSMRQFATLAATRELLTKLWAAGDEAEVQRVWAGVNFYTLAQRLNSQLPEEFTTWAEIQAMPVK